MEFFYQHLPYDYDPYLTFDGPTHVMHGGPTRTLEGFTWKYVHENGTRLARTVRYMHKLEGSASRQMGDFWADPKGIADASVQLLQDRLKDATEAKFKKALRRYRAVFGKDPFVVCVSFSPEDQIDFYQAQTSMSGATVNTVAKFSLAVTLLGAKPYEVLRGEMAESDTLPIPEVFRDGRELLSLVATDFEVESLNLLGAMKVLKKAHDDKHVTVATDDPLARMVGFADFTTRKVYRFPLFELREQMDKFDPTLRALFRTPDGRKKLFG